MGVWAHSCALLLGHLGQAQPRAWHTLQPSRIAAPVLLLPHSQLLFSPCLHPELKNSHLFLVPIVWATEECFLGADVLRFFCLFGFLFCFKENTILFVSDW